MYWCAHKTATLTSIQHTVVGGDYVHPIVRNHVKLGISLRVPYCVVDAGYGLGRSLEDCRPALPKGRKYQMVKT